MTSLLTDNPLLNTDSYKMSHARQYPPGTDRVYAYIESRGGEADRTLFFGLQGFLKTYMSRPWTREMVDEAEALWTAHGEPFYRELFDYVVEKKGGRLPLLIRALPEGSVVPTGTPLVTIENTDPNCAWSVSWMETQILRGVWYPTTVATNSFECKRILKNYFDLTSDRPELIDFKLHDFGARGVSSKESSMIGGAAHLVNFMGTDTFLAVPWLMQNYGVTDMPAFSIPAMEHSTVTSWGKENEVEAYRNMLKQFAKPGALVACVSDSWDVMNATSNIWGEQLRAEVVQSGATIVVRPDSGDPVTTPVEVVRTAR
jgi:nicotinamide phosphoribosyltransferase